jgi:hypothetical protein
MCDQQVLVSGGMNVGRNSFFCCRVLECQHENSVISHFVSERNCKTSARVQSFHLLKYIFIQITVLTVQRAHISDRGRKIHFKFHFKSSGHIIYKRFCLSIEIIKLQSRLQLTSSVRLIHQILISPNQILGIIFKLNTLLYKFSEFEYKRNADLIISVKSI